MTKIILGLFVSLLGMASNAQTSEKRDISGFTGISVADGIQVVVQSNCSKSVTIEAADSAALKNVITERQGKVLKIYLMNGAQGVVKVIISSGEVINFTASEKSAISLDSELVSKELSISLASGAKFSGNIKCTSKVILFASSDAMFEGKVTTKSFEGNLKNNSTASVTGYAGRADVRCASGSKFIADKFIVEYGSAHAENKSKIAFTVTNSIVAGSDDTSSVKYYGSPENTVFDTDSYAVKTIK
ncbi:MAG: hypothetical protein EOO45_08240 [Flavobacterium sp.]|nr:MAG: hypothetical protein EOO45_08240 [Flavobacterium sp.]